MRDYLTKAECNFVTADEGYTLLHIAAIEAMKIKASTLTVERLVRVLVHAGVDPFTKDKKDREYDEYFEDCKVASACWKHVKHYLNVYGPTEVQDERKLANKSATSGSANKYLPPSTFVASVSKKAGPLATKAVLKVVTMFSTDFVFK